MKKVAIVTDSNSGITQQDAKGLGCFVLPMPFIVNGEEFFEDINLTQQQFFERLAENADISTSQPAIGQLTEIWEEILKDHDEIVHIPMSSALSESMNTARNFAKEYNGKIEVVDNHRISVTQKQSVIDALKLASEGKNAKEIREYLEETKAHSSIYVMVDTLKYLKKGGRITPAVAAIGTILNIKPVLQIQGGKLDQFAKVMNIKAGKQKMINAIKADLEGKFRKYYDKGEMVLQIAYTNCREKAMEFAKEVSAVIGMEIKTDLINALSLSVACHIGSGAIAVACSRIHK